MRVIATVTLLVALVVACSDQKSRNSNQRMLTFPNDANGDVLRRMQSQGDDLSKPRNIDFEFIFQTEPNAKSFAKEAAKVPGTKVKSSRYEERRMWETTVTKHMLPTYENITNMEESLTRTAKLHDGEPDGWGCFAIEK